MGMISSIKLCHSVFNITNAKVDSLLNSRSCVNAFIKSDCFAIHYLYKILNVPAC